MSTYSPFLDSSLTDDHNQFVVPYRNPGTNAPGTLSGTVKNAIDCTPAVGVTVAYSGGSALTDAAGNFSTPANARKSLAITAGKSGWLSDARFGTSTLNATTEPSPTKIFVSTAGRISGHVLNSGGAPIAGATVTFSGGKLRLSKSVVTDGSGSYNTSWIAIGSYTVSVSATGYAATSGTATVNPGLTTTLDFSLHP